MRSVPVLALAAILAFPVLRSSAADIQYQIQPIVKVGGTVGDVLIPSDMHLLLAGLSDSGHILFVARKLDSNKPTWLIQYAGGSFIVIGAPGKEAPIGQWPEDVVFSGFPIGMNQGGNAVFVVHRQRDPAGTSLGTFLWDYQKRQVTTLIQRGMPAVNDLLFENGGSPSTGINNLGEIALLAAVKNAAGKVANGIFLLGRDGKILPIVLPDQELPDGRKVIGCAGQTISDGGVIAFRVGPSNGPYSAYTWEQGVIAPVAPVGQAAPGGGKIEDVSIINVTNKNRNLMVAATVRGSDALYLFKDGVLKPVAVPRQEMPGGGRFLERLGGGVSPGSEAGEYALVARLQDNTTAAYRVDTDGNLSLILKNGMMTPLGKITSIGPIGVAINSKGQVILPVQIDGGPETLVLLTPVAP